MPLVPSQEDFNALLSRVEDLESGLPAVGSVAPSIWHGNSGNSSELVDRLYLTYTNGYLYKAIYTIPLPTLHPGDIVEMHGTFEITNPHKYNVMGARYLIIADNPTDTAGIPVSEAAGRNVTPGMHHDTHQDFGTYVVTQEMSGKHAVMVGYAASSAASSSNVVWVEQDYGRLFVKVYRNWCLE